MIQELELTPTDKITLKRSIKISVIIGLLFCVVFIFIVAIVPGVLLLLGEQPAVNIVSRGLFVLGLLFIPFAAVSWKNILVYADVIKGKKWVIVSADYEINKTKNAILLRLKDQDNREIEISEALLPFIDVHQPLKIDITTISKTLIFISHNIQNFLDE